MSNLEVPFDVITYPVQGEATGIVVGVGGEVCSVVEAARKHERAKTTPVAQLGASALSLEGVFDFARYESAARMMSRDLSELMVISDQPEQSLVDSGAGVVHVRDAAGVRDSLDLLLDPAPKSDHAFYDSFPLYSDLAYDDVADTLFRPGKVNVVGFVGRTGAGKSTAIRRLVDTMQARGESASLFQVDSFFKLSRQERKAWLAEPGISEDERVERKRVANWWDLDAAAEALETVKSGQRVNLEGLYDMEQGGEKVGIMDINPDPSGHVVFVEGTALLLPQLSRPLDSLVYVNSHDRVRAASLLERNTRHGYTPKESAARKELTDAAETNDHISYPLRSARFLCGQLAVLDNSARGEHLKLLPPYIPKK